MRFVSLLSACAVVAVFSVSLAHAFSPIVDWSQTLPVLDAAGPAVVLPIDYGRAYAVAGTCGFTSQDAGNVMVFLLQTDSAGNMMQNSVYTTFPTPGLGYHTVHAFQQLVPGGFVIAGTRNMVTHIPTHNNGWVICTGSDGRVKWTKVFGTIAGNQEQNYEINVAQAMENGTIIVAGRNVDKAWVCCLDAAGAVRWSKTVDGDQVGALTPVSSCEVIAACITSNTTRSSISLVRLDATGKTVFCGPSIDCPAKNAYVPLVLPFSNLTTVFSVINSTTGVCQLMSYDAQASLQWEQQLSFNGFRFPGMGLSSFIPYGGRGYIASGALFSDQYGTSEGMWLARVEHDGSITWQWSSLDAQNALSIACVGSNGIIILARSAKSTSNLMLMKISQDAPQSGTEATPQPQASSAVPSAAGRAKSMINGSGEVFDVLGRLVPRTAAQSRVSREMLFRRELLNGQTRITPYQPAVR